MNVTMSFLTSHGWKWTRNKKDKKILYSTKTIKEPSIIQVNVGQPWEETHNSLFICIGDKKISIKPSEIFLLSEEEEESNIKFKYKDRYQFEFTKKELIFKKENVQMLKMKMEYPIEMKICGGEKIIKNTVIK